MIGRLLGLFGTAFSLVCMGTIAAEGVGLSLAMSSGLLTPTKLTRYAGVLYGLDPLDLAPAPQPEDKPAVQSRESILADRVQKTTYLADRRTTVDKTTVELRGLTLTLQRNREKFEDSSQGFEGLLDELEKGAFIKATTELRTTLEVAAPKQAKDILMAMLSAQPPVVEEGAPEDNVLKDVVGIITSLSDSRVKKILAEFKTDDEQRLLHRILMEIGELQAKKESPPTLSPPPAGAANP